ncbi:hypothetical protein E2C01_047396 [Portunus trituberculatus]|uniref:Uncharacterized protein n=1 Tax=Portunus trituberculatus TaxID=210409 RepID=A0A5B7G3G3_PORTR|nr:hypothetical protein [Portunus trituberculatus]
MYSTQNSAHILAEGFVPVHEGHIINSLSFSNTATLYTIRILHEGFECQLECCGSRSSGRDGNLGAV